MNKETVQLTGDLTLRPIAIQDNETLLSLMHRIYPPPYAHLWKDQGRWYVNHTFGKAQLTAELAEPDCPYYFVLYQGKAIGILRMCFDLAFPLKPDISASKLHRIYLDSSVQGRGIGKQLMQWCVEQSRQKGHNILWLEAMEVQSGARTFYEKFGFQQKGRLLLPFAGLMPGKAGLLQYYLPL